MSDKGKGKAARSEQKSAPVVAAEKACDVKDPLDDAYEKFDCPYKSLTDVGKYSYTALCAVALNKLFEQEECDQWVSLLVLMFLAYPIV